MLLLLSVLVLMKFLNCWNCYLLVILTLTLLKGRTFITLYDFESHDIVKSLDHPFIFCDGFCIPPKKDFLGHCSEFPTKHEIIERTKQKI